MIRINMQKTLNYLLLIGLVATLGCTRSKDTESTVSISMPQKMSSQKVGAQSFDTLGHLIINVTGPGINQPILFTWDAHDDFSSNMKPAPASIDLLIPQGSGRLIQVLAVYMDSNRNMQFYYGDVVKNLASANESAAISISSLNGGATIIGGDIMGRYITDNATAAGPTGPVEMVYTPTGKPTMIIERHFMWNGWFHFFGLVGANFGYRLADGNLMFGKELDLSEANFPASSKVLRVTKPIHQRKEQNNGVISWSTESAEIMVYGFFGPGAGNRLVCANSAPAPTSLARGDSNPLGSSLLAVDISPNAVPSLSQLLNDVTLPAIYLRGDLSTYNGAGVCSSVLPADKFNSWFKFEPRQVEYGKDNAAGFRGFFVLDSNSNMVNATIAGTNAVVTGTLLPGLEYTFDKVVLMKNVGMELNNQNDWAPCGMLPSKGFTPAGEAIITSSAFSLNAAFTAAEMSGPMALALCPFKAGVPYPMGAWLKMYGGGGGGGGGGMQAATKLAITEINPTPTNNLCSQFLVKPVDANNQLGSVSGGVMVSFVSGGAGAPALYRDPACMAMVVGSENLNPSGSYFYMKGSAVGAATLTVSDASGTPTLAASNTENFTVTAPGSLLSFGFLPDNTYAKQSHECIPFHLVGRGSAGGMGGEVDLYQSQPVNLTGANFYSDPHCATSISSFSSLYSGSIFYSAGTSTSIYPLFIRPTTSGNLSVSAAQASGTQCSGSPCSGNYNNFPIAGVSTSPVTQIRLNYATTMIPPGTCMLISVDALDANSRPTIAAVGQNIDIAIGSTGNCQNTSYIALTDSDCLSNLALSKSITIPAGESRVLVGLKNVAAGAGSCPIDATMPSASLTAAPPMNTSTW